MNLKQMEAFRAVMATGSTTEAAGRLGLSQSAVSRILSQLEESLKFPLFHRRKGRLEATGEANELLLAVEALVENMLKLDRVTDELRLGHAKRALVKVAVPTSMTHRRIPSIMVEFLRDRSDCAIELITGSYEALERAVLEEVADFAFVRLPTHLNEFEAESVLETEGVCVLPRGHNLRKKEFITPQDLLEVPLVLLGRQRSIRTELEEHFKEHQIEPLIRVEAHSVAAACALVAGGAGVSIVNRMLSDDFHHLDIEVRPFRPLLRYRFGMIWKKDRQRSKLASEFSDFMKLKMLRGENIVAYKLK
ncbi:LysR family transcriptional regulator [Pseudomonas asiatica]|uniref:LysR family transcriptional regulator n=1 Tax=Pseudomonas asiatica TaxID=2219225 RepID=UPI00383B334F